jgi:hypothetical protein
LRWYGAIPGDGPKPKFATDRFGYRNLTVNAIAAMWGTPLNCAKVRWQFGRKSDGSEVNNTQGDARV